VFLTVYNFFNYLFLKKAVGILGGLFTTCPTTMFHEFIMLISGIILQLTLANPAAKPHKFSSLPLQSGSGLFNNFGSASGSGSGSGSVSGSGFYKGKARAITPEDTTEEKIDKFYHLY
jgi:hypothetical protein